VPPQVLDTLSDSNSSTTANDLDLIFLKGIIDSPVEPESLEETRLEAVRDNNSLLETHDSVASQVCDTPPPSPCAYMELPVSNQPVPPDAVRMVGIRKVAGEHLGVTFRVEAGELVIARILHGGMIDQQGLLHAGDIIKEVNGKEVGEDPRVLQEILQDASGSVVLKILPSYQEGHAPGQVFVKCHYDYDPANDNLIPCKEAGLKFYTGDILQIVNQDDLNWWQARRCVEGGSAGLIPRNLCTGVAGKNKKKKMMYLTTKNAEFDRHELLIYEEVAKVPPFRRKTLVLIGALGVGRRSLKNKLLLSNPQHYGTTIPHIKNGRYLEHGEYDGNLYGTKMDSIHEVVEAGRICVLDANPQALKVLRTSEFLPYVVFIEAPDFEVLKAMNQSAVETGVVTKQLTDSELKRTVDESTRIQTAYGHYFDLTIVNDNLDESYRNLKAALEKVSATQQWVPVTWVF
ncbi:unnamed protein product, partial [Coregonus sp. 'balchen']